jgi:Tat protein secretion system quality control protein TatD with DNase activity
MFMGLYNEKQYHPEDLKDVLDRAWAANVERIIVTAGSLHEARAALDLARTDSECLHRCFICCRAPNALALAGNLNECC